MRVLHFLPWHSPRTKGGTEAFLLNLAKLQSSYGDTVEIIAPNNSKSIAYERIDGIKATYFPYPYGETDKCPNGALESEPAHKDFLDLVGAICPDVIHLHGIDYFFQSFFEPIAAESSRKLLLTIHLVNVVCPNQSLINELNQSCTRDVRFSTCAKCLSLQRHRNPLTSLVDSISIPLNDFMVRRWQAGQLADRIPYQRSILEQIALLDFIRSKMRVDVLSPWFYDVLRRNGFTPDRISLRPNPLLTADSFTKSPSRPTHAPRMKFLFVGRLSTDKGVALLIEALKGLADLRGEIEVTLVGRQVEPELIEDLRFLHTSGFEVRVPGEASALGVEEYFRWADYLVFPSMSTMGEMAPLIVQEALQNGLAVISSDLPSAAAFVREGLTGMFFKRDDATDLRRVIRTVVKEKSRLNFAFHPTSNLDATLYPYYQDLYTR